MEASRLSVKALAFASGVLWAGAFFVVGISNIIWPGYGQTFLDMIASVYPGYHGVQTVQGVMVGTFYALMDGLVGGALLAWLYNFFAAPKARSSGK